MTVTKCKVWDSSAGLSGVVTLIWISPWVCNSSQASRGVCGSPAAGGQIQSLSAVEALLKSQDIAAGQAAVVSRTCSSSYHKVPIITSFNLFFFQIKW